MTTLRLIFHGLLGFVVRNDVLPQRQLTVLFPKQNEPQQAYCTDTFVAAAHFPFLRFASSALDPASPRRPQYEISDGVGGIRDSILFLQGERLSIPGLSGGVTLVNVPTIPAGAEKPDPGRFDAEKKDFRWIAEMDDVVRDSGLVDFDTLNQNNLELIEAAFDLSGGTAGCYKLVGENPPANPTDATLFRLGAPVPKFQVLAEEIFIEMDVPSVTLQSVPLPIPLPHTPTHSPAPQQPALLLRPDANGVVECHVFNSELDLIVKPPSLPTITYKPRDFVELYELSAHRPPISSRIAPDVVSGPVNTGGGPGGGPAGDHICPAGVFHAP